jgi:hypothetical protein
MRRILSPGSALLARAVDIRRALHVLSSTPLNLIDQEEEEMGKIVMFARDWLRRRTAKRRLRRFVEELQFTAESAIAERARASEEAKR